MNTTVFITGTDTEIGKTLVSQALITALVNKGFSVSGFKPIAAGCERHNGILVNEDALALQQVINVPLSYQEINPYALLKPSSPHIAAKVDKVIIDLDVLTTQLKHHQSVAEITIVEGAGGWHVPITEELCLSDWVYQQKLPVILVVGIKLGCLNHALLTYEVLKNRGVNVVGWVANCVDNSFKDIEANVDYLTQRLDIPKLAEIPFLTSEQKKAAHQYMDISYLENLTTKGQQPPDNLVSN